MKERSSLVEKVKSALLLVLNRSPRLRWGLASLSSKQAFKSVCATESESDAEQIGLIDARRIVPFTRSTSRVLDIGCGVGRVEKYLAPYCTTIDAVDVSDGMLRIARGRLKGIQNVHLTRANATRLDMFRDETFDLCFSYHCLQHMSKEDAWLVLAEIHRLLRPTGTAVLHFPNFASDTYFSLFKDHRHWSDNSRVRAYTLPELEKMAQMANLRLIRSETLCLNPFVHPSEPNRDLLLVLQK